MLIRSIYCLLIALILLRACHQDAWTRFDYSCKGRSQLVLKVYWEGRKVRGKWIDWRLAVRNRGVRARVVGFSFHGWESYEQQLAPGAAVCVYAGDETNLRAIGFGNHPRYRPPSEVLVRDGAVELVYAQVR